MTSILTAALLFLLAAAHSVLGERDILGPLFEAEWRTNGEPRWAVERLVRLTWHAASVAWVGLGALALGASAWGVVAATSFATGALLFFMIRGHFGWVLFWIAGAASMHAAGALTPALLMGVAIATAALGSALALLHVAWAVRGAPSGVLPEREDGRPMFTPGPLACLAVAALLVVFSVLVVWPIVGAGFERPAKWLVLAGCSVLTLRALGDGRSVGFSKSERRSAFARRDDAYYTPLVVWLAAGAGAAAMLA